MKAKLSITLIAIGLLTMSVFKADNAIDSPLNSDLGSLPLAPPPLATANGLDAQGIQPVMFWHIVTVDSKGILASSLVLDKDAHAHVSYPAGTPLDTDLNYAHWTGSQWEIEIADRMNQLESTGKSVLKLDGAGYPHIGYDICNPFYCTLGYVHLTSSQWIVEQIDSSISGASLSMALDASDHPRFSYCRQRGESLELRHAYWANSQWFTETIDANSGCWFSTSIDIDSSGLSHISYYNSDAADLMYAHWTGTKWITQTVDSAGDVGNSNSLMLDTNGNPHIGYMDSSNDSLKYAVWAGTGWTIQTIDSAGNFGSYTSLVLDDQNRPHLTYTGAGNNTIRYGRWTGNEWYMYTVAPGSQSWLTLDSTDQPHISYWNDGLKYAWGQVLTMTTYIPVVINGQE